MDILKKFQNFIYKYIFYISLYVSCTGILYLIDNIFFNRSIYSIHFFNYISFGIVDLKFFRSDTFLIHTELGESRYVVISILTILFMLLFLLGTFLYNTSKKTEYRLLQFCYAVIFIAGIGFLLIDLIPFSFRSEVSVQMYFILLLVALKKIFLIYVAYVFLKKSGEQQQLISRYEEDEKSFLNSSDLWVETHEKTSRKARFAHYIIDVFIMILIFSKYIFFLPRSFTRALEEIFGDRLATFVLFFVVSTIYYLVFEGIFKTTPGKYLLQNRVVSHQSEKVRFSQIVARTFSRRIPFEAFSFFGVNGWHDSLSKTGVVKLKTNEVYGRWAKAALIVTVSLIVLKLIYDFLYPF